MTGVLFTVGVDAASLGQAENVLARLADADLADLTYAVGQLAENQTKERIATEKTGPDGTAWAPWSEAYDNSRSHDKHSLLVAEGNLRDSIQNYSNPFAAVVGSNLIYAAHHQFGTAASKRRADAPSGAVGAGIPARPYLGLSPANRIEIEELVGDYLGGLLA